MVVGLGNPGRKYVNTRHNAGFKAADALLDRGAVMARGKWTDGEIAMVEAAGRRFLVVKPQTFMNNSGSAVAAVLETYGLSPEAMVVIHDDIDIELGELRVKQGGGTAGHRGLASLVREAGSADFTRVRVGVGRPPDGVDPAEYVLTGFTDDEKPVARSSTERAARAALEVLSGAADGGSV